jgi:hypothetical protein
MYEIVGCAIHTETEEQLVVYRPLYDVSDVLGEEAYHTEYFVRPITMFTESVLLPNGTQCKRFTKI